MAWEQQDHDVFWIEHLSKSQEDAIASMMLVLQDRKIASPGHHDRITCARFLKARKWDVDLAVIMYERMASFRIEWNLDSPEHTFNFPEHSKVLAVYPHFYHKTDKWGRPVYYELLGELNATELMKVTTVERLVQYHIHCWEKTKSTLMPICSDRVGRDIFTAVTILDLKGSSVSNFTAAVRTFIATISKIDQDNYPEHLGQMFIVNAPYVFAGIWSVVKPWLELRTQKKIHVISCAKTARQRLLQVIPAENLLTRFGGTSMLESTYGSEDNSWDAKAAKPLLMKENSSSVSSERIGASVEDLPELREK